MNSGREMNAITSLNASQKNSTNVNNAVNLTRNACTPAVFEKRNIKNYHVSHDTQKIGFYDGTFLQIAILSQYLRKKVDNFLFFVQYITLIVFPFLERFG